MSSSKYKYLAVMATETGQQEEWKAENKEEEGASIIVDVSIASYLSTDCLLQFKVLTG